MMFVVPNPPRKPRPTEGTRFGRLVILHDEEPRGERIGVRCDCGNVRQMFIRKLRNGSVRSCGCGPNRGRFCERGRAAEGGGK